MSASFGAEIAAAAEKARAALLGDGSDAESDDGGGGGAVRALAVTDEDIDNWVNGDDEDYAEDDDAPTPAPSKGSAKGAARAKVDRMVIDGDGEEGDEPPSPRTQKRRSASSIPSRSHGPPLKRKR